MMPLNVLLTAVGAWMVVWYECGENPAMFCYRMGIGAFTSLRDQALMLAPVAHSSMREQFRCLNRSGISSIRFTTLKD
jgi:hypothetical protein